MKICIVTPTVIGPTETFIQAALDSNVGELVHVHGNSTNGYHQEEHPLTVESTRRTRRTRPLNSLPKYVEHRIRKRFFPPVTPQDELRHFFDREKIDLVLAEYGPTGVDVLPTCQSMGLPLVVHFHGYDASRNQTIGRLGELYKELFAYAASVIVVSEQMKSDLMALGCPEAKIEIIYYVPNQRFFDIEPDYSSNNIVMVGRLTSKKAPHLTLLAFSIALQQFPDLRLKILGDGELRSVCRDLARSLHIEEKVEFLGVCDRQAILDEFSKAFLFLQHSVTAYSGDREGTPVAILEACAAALPVIATRHAGICDVIQHEKSGLLVNEHDVDGMAASMAAAAEDRDWARTLGTKARSHVKEHFSQEKYDSGMQKVFSLYSYRIDRSSPR